MNGGKIQVYQLFQDVKPGMVLIAKSTDEPSQEERNPSTWIITVEDEMVYQRRGTLDKQGEKHKVGDWFGTLWRIRVD